MSFVTLLKGENRTNEYVPVVIFFSILMEDKTVKYFGADEDKTRSCFHTETKLPCLFFILID